MFPTYFHLAAYFASLTNGSTLTPVAAISDQVLSRTTANNYISPKPVKLYGWYPAGVSISDAQINTPSLRYVGLPFAGQLNAALVVPSPPTLAWWGETGVRIPEVDEIQMLHSLGGAAPENEFSLLWLMSQFKPITPGPTFRLKFTGAIVAVAGTWVAGTLTPFSTLPQGTYDVVGLDVVGANLIAGRLIFPGSTWRPGVLARNLISSVPHPHMVDGSLGCFGTFKSVNLPNLEILSSGANTVQTVYMDVVRTGDFQP
jgi:hypothetical protein